MRSMVGNPLEKANSMKILATLYEKERSFTELQISAKITSTELNRRLKEFQKLGLIQSKKLGKTKREGVLYSLTEKGEMLFPALLDLYKILKKLEMEV